MNGFSDFLPKPLLAPFLRPWKLLSLAAGLSFLIGGSYYYRFEDWDVGISLLMGIMTYLFAPWSVRMLVLQQWRWLPVVLFLYWLTVDGAYVAYNEYFGHWYVREANFYASSCLYWLCGFIWLHDGPLRELFRTKTVETSSDDASS